VYKAVAASLELKIPSSRRSTPATTTKSLYLGTITATAVAFLPLVFLPALSGFFYYQVPQESSSTCFVVKSSLTGLTLFKHTQRHPSLTEVRLMKMPYKQDFIAALLASREQGIGAMLAFIMAYLRGAITAASSGR
jgi:hypothetical protein